MKKFLIILFLALTLNTNAFATRLSTFNEDSGYSYYQKSLQKGEEILKRCSPY